MISPVYYVSENEENYKYNLERKSKRGILSIVSTADLHFGVIDPKTEYEILDQQFINKIEKLPFVDIIAICGDITERKYMSNTDPILYATMFINKVVLTAKKKGATVIIIKGTDSHEADQLKLFYHYIDDPDVDIRIVENIKFEYVKGVKILCIPELYGIEEDIYMKYLKYSGIYDLCFMHGTIEGAVRNNSVKESRLFTMDDFCNNKGPIISGHVHPGGCYHTHFYYTGTPIRYEFGQESPKGFLITLYDLDERRYYNHLEEIVSFKYDTISLDEIILNDPKDVIDYINNLKEEQNIDYLRIAITRDVPTDNMEIIKAYYRNNGKVRFKQNKKKDNLDDEYIYDQELFDKYDYMFDPNMNEYDILAKYINDDKGYIYTTGEVIKSLVEEKI